MKKKPFIFISYTDDGSEAAERLKTAFDSSLIAYWEWKEQMRAGDPLIKFIRAVEGATFFVPIISGKYKSRPATNAEFEAAFSREFQLQHKFGIDFQFVLPLMVSTDDNLPDGLRGRYYVKSENDIVSAVEHHLGKITMKEMTFSFRDWPHCVILPDATIDLLTIVGHSGKESKPSQSDIDNLGLDIDIGIECRNQSQRIAEFLPYIYLALCKRSQQYAIAKGINHSFDLSQKLCCHVDWHAIKYHKDELRNQNILALGAGDTNLISRWILSYYQQYLPIRFDSPTGSQTLYCDSTGTLDATEIDSVETDAHRYGALILIAPNPLNSLKVAIVAAGLTALGTQAAMLALADADNLAASSGSYDGNYVRVLLGRENNWRAIGYSLLR